MTAVPLASSNLERRYRPGSSHEIVAVRDVSLEISSGSFVALVGASGSGKSTLLALLGALDRPTSGTVRFGDQELSGCSDVELARLRRRMGFVFQSESLIPRLPAWENVSYPLVAQGVGEPSRRQLAESLLDRLGLASRFEALPEELSGGEQQRWRWRGLLSVHPRCCWPTNQRRTSMRNRPNGRARVFREVHSQGTTVVVATHDPELVESATRVVTLEAGRVIDDQDGRDDGPEEIVQDAATIR
ncbi:MAG: peptide ABC transporter ATP-binding protein [Planctomycetaceae bacterium]|nr:MAG: peptide ABC transporter ATP-binding protein [Planctomycetaceae bacterium]